MWEEGKTQFAVRSKWGPKTEAEFAHANSTDTIEDDQTAEIKVDGNTAVVIFTTKEISPTSLIKVDGHWLVDIHAMFDLVIKDDPQGDKDHVSTGKLMKQLRADIAAGKFDDADSFINDFQARLKARLTGIDAMQLVYLDNNATTEPAPEVVEAMLPYLTECTGMLPACIASASAPGRRSTKHALRWRD